MLVHGILSQMQYAEPPVPNITATGGNITKDGDYVVHSFTTSGTFQILDGEGQVEYVVVAGGGGGGSNGGGGGAGGYRSSVTGEYSGGGADAETPLTMTAGSYTVTVGSGGAGGTSGGNGSDGNDSVFHTITSVGGGGAGSDLVSRDGHSGGSGGGAGVGGGAAGTGGAGTTNQGYAGGDKSTSGPNYGGGGGGGAGAVGVNGTSTSGGNGGAPVYSSITGVSTPYAGGGGSGAEGGTAGLGAAGGGGNGTSNSTVAQAGFDGYGGGGGGSGYSSGYVAGGAGGSGIVIVRYYNPDYIDADAQAFLTATGISDTTITSAINELVLDFKAAGIWTLMDAIYPLVGGTADTHKYNLKDPQDTDAAFRLTYTGTITHSANGMQGDGSTGIADTQYTPSVEQTLNDRHFSMYSRTNSEEAGYDMGSYNTAVNADGGIGARWSGNIFYPIMNSTSAYYSAANSDSTGFFVANRQTGNSGNLEGYKFNTRVVNTSVTDVLSAAPMGLMGRQSIGTPNSGFTTRQYAFFSMGAGLTQTQQGDMYTAVQAFQTTLGRNV